VVAATVRRLDALPGRPAPEDTYLVLFDRVWLRRDLYWAGFLIWVLLVFRGIPGRWRGAGTGERRRRGRLYLPGFAFRWLFLVTLLVSPVFTAPLLFPAALLCLVPVAIPVPEGWWRALAVLPWLGFLPALFYLAFTATAWARGLAVGWALGLAPSALLAATLAAYAFLLVVRRRAIPPGAAAADDAP